jgi:hypothetical protein
MLMPFNLRTLAAEPVVSNSVPTMTLAFAFAVTPVRLVLALIAAAMAIALAAFVEEVAVTSEAVSDAVAAASIATPLIRIVPAASTPVVLSEGAAVVKAEAREVLLTVETFEV